MPLRLFSYIYLTLFVPLNVKVSHLQQDDGVLEEGSEDEEDAANDPRLHRVQPVRLWRVCSRRVEDVHLKHGLVSTIISKN